MLTSLLDKKRRRLFVGLVLIALIQSLCMIGMMYEAKTALQSDTFSLSAGWVALAIGGVFIIAIGRYMERYLAEIFAQQYINELRHNVFAKVLQLPVSDALMINKGGTLLRLTGDMSAIRNWIVNGLVPAIILSVWLLVAITGLTRIHYLFSLSLVPLTLLIMAGNYWIGKHLYTCSAHVRRIRGQLIRNVTEKLREFKVIQSFNQHNRERKRFNEQSDRLAHSSIKRANMSGVLRGFNEAILGGGILTLLVVGFLLEQKQMIQTSDIAIVMTAALYLLSHLRPLSRLYELWTLKKVAEHKLEYFFNRKTMSRKGLKKHPTEPLRLSLNNFSSHDRFPAVTTSIKEGNRILITGQQDSGKSSLLAALAGLLRPTSGDLRINDIEINHYNPLVISQLATLMCPDMPLLRGTLRKNLFYGARRITDPYTQEVLSVCGLDLWISGLPSGLDTRLQENGANLSDSQRYKIMLARALLRRPKILLIDSDSAQQSQEIMTIINAIFSWYKGIIITATDMQATRNEYDQIWTLSSECQVRKTAEATNSQAKNMQIVRKI
ncbi:ABC transporter transmembrane domain-containing protein [Neptunomonas antarctica]|uniref:ABC-type multidrug transport system, ATPase and permease component n=1 Tax=Neptunomonas antarctica TaxID=619304 RepID=A0A1N7J4R1_9GAMM|nr:ABC transporter transmembrane domain-containing protein [Neptunomonas antarctica]SIS44289.1 ABC-type multidrug transport system, ATPase and permease component [Neptunomonas antarctica]